MDNCNINYIFMEFRREKNIKKKTNVELSVFRQASKKGNNKYYELIYTDS